MKYGFRSPDCKNRKTLEGRKLIIAGSAGGPAASGSMCNLSLLGVDPQRVGAKIKLQIQKNIILILL